MEELKRDPNVNKVKRTRSDHVKQVVTSYLQKRNYPLPSPQIVSLGDFTLASFIENEISRPNSILYSCFNNDPVIIDHTFSKFIIWLKDLLKTKGSYEDLELIVGPLFCHVYLEILRGGHTERAASFFKVHLPSVDMNKCDNLVKELIKAFASDFIELPSLRDNFRCNKYVVKLSVESVNVLRKFLVEAGHVVLLQVFQSWFTIEENQMGTNQEEYEEGGESTQESVAENVDLQMQTEEMLCNGHGEFPKDTNLSVQKLLNAIDAVKTEPPSIYSINIENVKDDVTCAKLHRKGGFCAYSYNNSIILRSLKTLYQLDNTLRFGEMVLLGHSGRIYDISIIDKYNHLISASQDKTVRLYDLQDYSEKTVYKGHEYPIYCLSSSANGDYFVSGSYDYSARLWCLVRNETLRIFVGHTQEIMCTDFHPNCTYVLTGSADQNIRMWSIKDAEPLRLYPGTRGAVYAICVSPNGRYLASTGEDRRLRIWDLASAKQLSEIKTGPVPAMKIAISSDETMITTGCLDGMVKIWDFDALIKSTVDPNNFEPVLTVELTPKLLALDYCFGTFGCLTVQHSASVAFSSLVS